MADYANMATGSCPRMNEVPRSVKRVVVTGGPCAGKTSAMELLRSWLERDGVKAVFVPEAATELIVSGFAPWTCASMLEFQTAVIARQLEHEAHALEEAKKLGPSALIICDRGVCDSHAYLSGADYDRALETNGLTEEAAIGRYDVVIHLQSVAKANPSAYTRENNVARFEDAEEASLADDRVAAAWDAHPHREFVGCQEDFTLKALSAYQVLNEFLRMI